jgi:hypothetical protein
VLEHPIKSTGEHEVTIKLHHDVATKFNFQVKSTEEPKSEAPAAAEHPEKKHRSFFRRKKETQ